MRGPRGEGAATATVRGPHGEGAAAATRGRDDGREGGCECGIKQVLNRERKMGYLATL